MQKLLKQIYISYLEYCTITKKKSTQIEFYAEDSHFYELTSFNLSVNMP